MIISESNSDSKDAAGKPNRGQKSRAAILQAAAELATVRGLDGLSIGDLAEKLKISKSGLYAHFKSKEELQLATVETAMGIFDREVIQPGTAGPAGVARIRALADEFLAHVKRRTFPGGCFFAAVAAEMGMRPGPVRDRVVGTVSDWLALLEQCVREAQELSEIDPAADASQIAFETESVLLTANMMFMLSGDQKRLAQARTGLEHVLARYAISRKLSPRSPTRS